MVDIYIAGFFMLSLNVERATVAVDGNFGSNSVTGVLLSTRKKIQNKYSKSLYPNQKQLINYKKNSESVNKG